MKIYQIRPTRSYVSISCNGLELSITKEQGARLLLNEFACIMLRFLKDNRNLLNEALDYRLRHNNRAVYWYTSDFGATDYYIKYVTDNGFVASKFLFHETMSGFVLDDCSIKVFLPDLLHLILNGALDFASDEVVLDFANKLIGIINNDDDTDLQLYQLLQNIGATEIRDITERNNAEYDKLAECEHIYRLRDLIR